VNKNQAHDDLSFEYRLRFTAVRERRIRVWRILVDDYFSTFIRKDAVVLDLGCGWGEFINQIEAAKRYGMDLNPDTRDNLDEGVEFLWQDCSEKWPLPEDSLDWVFTSNFFEHLPDKAALNQTLMQAHRCLKPGGRIICLGPNIKALHGHYWDFYDHYIPLTGQSLKEALELRNFEVETVIDRFLPYTMVNRKLNALFLARLYLKLRPAWRIFGKQFLLVARKPDAPAVTETEAGD